MSITAQQIADARTAVADAQAYLTVLVRNTCIGPHRPRVHHDGRGPWCDACKRYPDGRLVLSSDA